MRKRSTRNNRASGYTKVVRAEEWGARETPPPTGTLCGVPGHPRDVNPAEDFSGPASAAGKTAVANDIARSRKRESRASTNFAAFLAIAGSPSHVAFVSRRMFRHRFEAGRNAGKETDRPCPLYLQGIFTYLRGYSREETRMSSNFLNVRRARVGALGSRVFFVCNHGPGPRGSRNIATCHEHRSFCSACSII